MRRFLLSSGALLIAVATTFAQEVELDHCLRDGGFCSETPAAVVDSSCGQVFYAHRGRLTWAPLRNAGPVTIAVQTRRKNLLTVFPLYVELVAFIDTLECETRSPISVVLVAQGTGQCEGIWESVGPIDLTRHSIPLGTEYRVQVEFFATIPDVHGVFRSSVGLSCIRVTSHADTTAVTYSSWSLLKSIYR
jgi:hypothetical protein